MEWRAGGLDDGRRYSFIPTTTLATSNGGPYYPSPPFRPPAADTTSYRLTALPAQASASPTYSTQAQGFDLLCAMLSPAGVRREPVRAYACLTLTDTRLRECQGGGLLQKPKMVPEGPSYESL